MSFLFIIKNDFVTMNLLFNVIFVKGRSNSDIKYGYLYKIEIDS